MIPVTGLHHTGVFVRDLKRARRFYEEVLGMECFLDVGKQAFLRFGRGDEIALFEDPDRAPTDGEEALHDPHMKGHVAFSIDGADYEDAKAWMADNGIAATPIDWGDHECLYFLDPDGNLLELGGPHDSTE